VLHRAAVSAVCTAAPSARRPIRVDRIALVSERQLAVKRARQARVTYGRARDKAARAG